MNKYEIWAKTLQLFTIEAETEESALELFQKNLNNPNLPIEFGIVKTVEENNIIEVKNDNA